MHSVIRTDCTGNTTTIHEEEMVLIPVQEFRRLTTKAKALDMLADDIRFNIDHGAASYGVVDANLVRVLTGTKAYIKRAAKTENANE